MELTSSDGELATCIHELGSNLQSFLDGIGADRVVIRRADFSKTSSNRDGPRVRLLTEGGLTMAARSAVDEVLILAGKDLAARCAAASKSDLDQLGEAACPGHANAAAAALSGLA